MLASPTDIAPPLLLFLLTLCISPAPRAQQAPVDGLEASPILSDWAARLASSDPEAEERFWQMVRDAGVPFVEPDPSRAGHSIVTFLARGGPGVNRMIAGTGICSPKKSFRDTS